MDTYSNKWLNQQCPNVNNFEVDNSKSEYYIQYYQTKTLVSALNSDWKKVKDNVDTLKRSIDELKQSIDSEQYKSQTINVIEAIDTSIATLNDNYTKLFNSVVKRMEESAESDEWFAETAAIYAAYIANGILGRNPQNGANPNITPTVSQPTVTPQYESSPYTQMSSPSLSSGGSYGGSNGGGSNSSGATGGSSSSQPILPVEDNYQSQVIPNQSDNNGAGSSQPNEELVATNVQYSPNIGDGSIDVSKYHNKPESGFIVTTDNPKYNLSDSDIELITAIVSAESDKSYDDALAVASTIFNRCEAPKWASCGGNNPVKQATAPNQFVVYQHGSYKKYMGNGAPDTCRQAVLDVINGARNHDYLSFRSNGTKGYSSNMITSSGNRYK